MSPEQIWSAVQEELRFQLAKPSYETWLRNTSLLSAEAGIFRIGVPSKLAKDWLEDRFAGLIQETLQAVTGNEVEVDFVVSHTDHRNGHESDEVLMAVDEGVVPPVAVVATDLNERFKFSSFVVGNNSRFAHAAAKAVADAPGETYNPLFLYGGVGLGKTHLMHAIGHEVRSRFPIKRVLYLTSEQFMNEVIASIQNARQSELRMKYRTVDVLLIDDIQFLAQKERTQEEFFHTFNALHESMKQIVIASDRPPKELAEIEDRLRSRFEWGLIADIQPPDLETKVAILQKKSETERVPLPTDLALYIASNVRTNVRELEGALIRLIAYCSLTGAEVTLSTAQQVLKNFIDSQARKISIDAIQKAVAEQFGLRTPEIKQKNNSRSIVVPRQIAMYLAKQMTEASLPEIGRQFGGKHHTTVMHSIAKIDEQRRADKDLNRLINKLTETLNG